MLINFDGVRIRVEDDVRHAQKHPWILFLFDFEFVFHDSDVTPVGGVFTIGTLIFVSDPDVALQIDLGFVRSDSLFIPCGPGEYPTIVSSFMVYRSCWRCPHGVVREVLAQFPLDAALVNWRCVPFA